MPPRAVDADEDPEIDAEPLRVGSIAVAALVVARETTNRGDDTLEGKRRIE